MLNSAGNVMPEESAEVTEKPGKTPAAALEVQPVIHLSIGRGCFVFLLTLADGNFPVPFLDKCSQR